MQLSDVDILNKNFPYLWPGNRGIFSENRKPRISFEEYVRHCIMLYHGRFWDADFISFAYNVVCRRKMYKMTGVRCAISTPQGQKLGEYLAGVTDADLDSVIKYKQLCLSGKHSKSGITPPKPSNFSEKAELLLKNCEHVQGVVPHTDQAARNNRNSFFAMSYYFGKPTLWFSFNHAFHCNPVFTHLASGVEFKYEEYVAPTSA